MHRTPGLVVKRDWSVWMNGEMIGLVRPDPTDSRVNHRWDYGHVSKITLDDLHPEWEHVRRVQSVDGMRSAAESLLQLHRRIGRERPEAVS
jgi:hypothetical protein